MLQKIEATFDSYWNTAVFETYDENSIDKLKAAIEAANSAMNPTTEDQPFLFDLQLYPYQQEILDRLQAEREIRGYYRNLVVAATGARHIISTGRKAAKIRFFRTCLFFWPVAGSG